MKGVAAATAHRSPKGASFNIGLGQKDQRLRVDCLQEIRGKRAGEAGQGVQTMHKKSKKGKIGRMTTIAGGVCFLFIKINEYFYTFIY
jgi:hypothetical protein